jgi:hypothetical protein
MTYPKLLALVTFLLFALIIVMALMKGDKAAPPKAIPTPAPAVRTSPSQSIVVELGQKVREIRPPVQPPEEKKPVIEPVAVVVAPVEVKPNPVTKASTVLPAEFNRIDMLFNLSEPRFPFVETITYKSRVAWQKGRPAWLSDYASHYNTSRHFIARSLNGKPDYTKQDLSEGNRFNVLRKDVDLSFFLIVDISRNKMWFYAYDNDSSKRYLVRTYSVGLGRPDPQRVSGYLTPRGKYSLGSKIAIYKPKIQGYYNGKKVEMMRVFGSRWIPFDKEISGCTTPAKGLGIHGIPLIPSATGDLIDDPSSLGKYESDGCVHLATADMEELFSIIITKPTVIELVADFGDANLPGEEWKHTH